MSDNIIQFPKTAKPTTKRCERCRGKGVESARIGRMYSEITCRDCKGKGETP